MLRNGSELTNTVFIEDSLFSDEILLLNYLAVVKKTHCVLTNCINLQRFLNRCDVIFTI